MRGYLRFLFQLAQVYISFFDESYYSHYDVPINETLNIRIVYVKNHQITISSSHVVILLAAARNAAMSSTLITVAITWLPWSGNFAAA